MYFFCTYVVGADYYEVPRNRWHLAPLHSAVGLGTDQFDAAPAVRPRIAGLCDGSQFDAATAVLSLVV